MGRDRAPTKSAEKAPARTVARDVTVYLFVGREGNEIAVSLPPTTREAHDVRHDVETVLTKKTFPQDELYHIIGRRRGEALSITFESLPAGRIGGKALDRLLRRVVSAEGQIADEDTPGVTLRWVDESVYRQGVADREKPKAQRGELATGPSLEDGHLSPLQVTPDDIQLAVRQLVACTQAEDEPTRTALHTAIRELVGDPRIRTLVTDAIALLSSNASEGVPVPEHPELTQTVAALRALTPATPLSEVQNVVSQLEGRAFGSLEGNKLVCRELREALKRRGLKVVCQLAGCGEPSILRCQPHSDLPHGRFQFDHSIVVRDQARVERRARVFHGSSTTFPKLVLIRTSHSGS